MKTPKRYQNKPLPMLPEDNVVDDWVIETWCARAKRKNKIAQLKRSLEKYKYGKHLYYDVGASYRVLQDLVRPGKKATFKQWLHYIRELQRVQKYIACAISNAGLILSIKAEEAAESAKYRKEQNNA